jgi:hypothetical protein
VVFSRQEKADSSASVLFQLVLQGPASSLNGFDEILNIEDLLTAKLIGQSEVNGDDFGSGEVNISFTQITHTELCSTSRMS